MDFSYEGIALIPIITIIVNVIKKLGVHQRFAPLISLILGIVFGVFFLSDNDIRKRILLGILMGTSASGLYSHGKSVTRTVKYRKVTK